MVAQAPQDVQGVKKYFSVALAHIPEHQRSNIQAIVTEHRGTWSGDLPDLVLRRVEKNHADDLVVALAAAGADAESWPDSIVEQSIVDTAEDLGLVAIGPRPIDTWVILVDYGDKKIQVIKIIRETFRGLGLKEAKELVESAPVLLRPLTTNDANAAMVNLQDVGAVCEIVTMNEHTLVDVILLKMPRGPRSNWPHWLRQPLRGVRSVKRDGARTTILTRLSSHLASNIVQTIAELGGDSMTVPAESTNREG